MKNLTIKKKWIITTLSILLAVLLFTNTGYAASVTKKISAIYNSYVVKSNGIIQKTETVQIGSKVYIPITDVSKITGADVSKSGNTYNLVSNSSNSEEIKENVRILHQYKGLIDLGEYIGSMYNYLSNATDEIILNNNRSELDKTIDHFNKVIIANYNSQLTNIENLKERVESKGYSMKTDYNNMSTIINEYSDSINLIKQGIQQIEEFYNTSSSYNQSQSYNYLSKGAEKRRSAQSYASKEYYNQLSSILN